MGGCVRALAAAGPMRLGELRVVSGVTEAAPILQRNVYGWFHRVRHAREGGGSAGASVQERLTGRSSLKLPAADAACSGRASWQPAIRTTSRTGLRITSTGHFLRAGL